MWLTLRILSTAYGDMQSNENNITNKKTVVELLCTHRSVGGAGIGLFLLDRANAQRV